MVVASTMDRVKNWAKKNNKTIHDKGFVIIAPPGSGKSFWVRKHQKDWVDADCLCKISLKFKISIPLVPCEMVPR